MAVKLQCLICLTKVATIQLWQTLYQMTFPGPAGLSLLKLGMVFKTQPSSVIVFYYKMSCLKLNLAVSINELKLFIIHIWSDLDNMNDACRISGLSHVEE